MNNHYKTAIKQLASLTNEEKAANQLVREAESNVARIQSRTKALAGYLLNEVEFLPVEEGKELRAEINRIFDVKGFTPGTEVSEVTREYFDETEVQPGKSIKQKVNAIRDGFNRTVYTLVQLSQMGKRKVTSAQLTQALQESSHAEKFTNSGSIKAAISKLIQKGFIKRTGDKLGITKAGAEQAAEYSTKLFSIAPANVTSLEIEPTNDDSEEVKAAAEKVIEATGQEGETSEQNKVDLKKTKTRKSKKETVAT